MRGIRSTVIGGTGLLAAAALAATLGPGTALATGGESSGTNRAALNSLNNSGVTGRAEVRSQFRQLRVEVDAHGLAKGLPHAQHIHFGATARNECPTVAQDDDNGDFRLETLEGAPAYGPVRVSLTKRGDTSADSVLAVDRYPTAPRGHLHYARDMKTSGEVARGIRAGKAVVVIHGVDYNGNGEYDFASAGESDLNSDLPAEATDPAACGVLR